MSNARCFLGHQLCLGTPGSFHIHPYDMAYVEGFITHRFEELRKLTNKLLLHQVTTEI